MRNTKQYIRPFSVGVTDETQEDTNDCALRAYCNVTGVSFKDAQIRFCKHGRKFRKGTQYAVLHKLYTNAGMTPELMGSTKLSKYIEYTSGLKSIGSARTIGSLLADPKYSKGKYVFCTVKHAFAVLDGGIIDTYANAASARVYMVYNASGVSK